MRKKTIQYFREYKWSNVLAMIRNNTKPPKVCHERFEGKLVLITGATSGIGYMTARKYASQGANILCVNRNQEKSEKLQRELESEFGVSCTFKIADLSKLADVFSVSKEIALLNTPIDVVIHNAGVYLTKRELSVDGIEMVFAVHYLSSFIMNYLLMSKLKQQDNARIIMVGSEGHRFAAWGLRLDDLNWEKRSYSGLKSYGSAKLAQLLSMLCFAERFNNSGLTINTMHPGAVKTDTGQENGPLYRWFKSNCFDKLLNSPEVSAEALYYLGVSKDMDGISGMFFNLTTEEEPAPPALDRGLACELWEQTLKLTGVKE
ncbi:MAG: short-chain dehydrogenase [Candidatus Cloacimonetes bacterium HGW-Cloacimonetes-1]|jgi:NAD(P)-dependent dehydrogenase (short-subunit alcohol dehydrogenase family)|nr:MAG: short-chain dehydrogenase [Candidatus Cloacimonetes bacterium HGW-Cloacimonetes-1]